MDTIYNSVIGCDVHRDTIVCCALQKEGDNWHKTLKTFPTTGNALIEMAGWCQQFSPDYVLLESTGVYWMSPYKHLERAGLRVAIINPHHIKRMAGKKTDTEDAKWLAELGTVGSFTPSYILSEQWRNLRSPSRYLTRLIQIQNVLKNREIKTFVECGYRFNVFSDPFGKNGTTARNAILEGKLPQEILKMLDLNRLKASDSDILEALNGELSEWHKLTILANRKILGVITEEIAHLKTSLINKVKGLDEDFFHRVQTLPGVSEFQGTQMIIENGGQEFVDYFKNDEQYSSWLGVCPGNKESGGKRFSGKCRKGNRWLRRHLTEAAQAAVKCNGSTIQSKYRARRGILGTKKAIFASAHYLARMFYLIAKDKHPYRDPNIDYEKAAFENNLKRYVKKARQYVEWKVEAQNRETGETFSSENAKRSRATSAKTSKTTPAPQTKTAKTAPASKAETPQATSTSQTKTAKAASTPQTKTAKAASTLQTKTAKAAPASQAEAPQATSQAKTAKTASAPQAKTPQTAPAPQTKSAQTISTPQHETPKVTPRAQDKTSPVVSVSAAPTAEASPKTKADQAANEPRLDASESSMSTAKKQGLHLMCLTITIVAMVLFGAAAMPPEAKADQTNFSLGTSAESAAVRSVVACAKSVSLKRHALRVEVLSLRAATAKEAHCVPKNRIRGAPFRSKSV